MSLIEQTFIEINETSYIKDKKEILDNEITYFIIERRMEDIENPIIAKYIIFDFDDLNQNNVLESENNFSKFQEKFIAPIYYDYRNDLRWNIYLIVVCSDDINLDNNVSLYEKNENYARKLFFKKSEFVDFLANGYIGNLFGKASNVLKTDFILEWDQLLVKCGLNGCLYNSFNRQAVKDYVEKEKNINPVGRPITKENKSKIDKELRIRSIAHIRTNDYRSHCIGEQFDFLPSQVNLLSGPNGSGKSSICEAIEYALTGETIRNKKAKEGTIIAKCITINNIKINMKSNKTTQEKRKLDTSWYGTTGTGYKSNLNANFSIFNYLSANEATKYAASIGDINELLKNLIYGEDITEAQKKAERFQEEFSALRKDISGEMKKKQKSISDITNEISLISNIDVDFLDVKSKIARLGIGMNLYENMNEMQNYFAQLKSKFIFSSDSISNLSAYLNSFIKINSYDELVLEKNKLQVNINKLNALKERKSILNNKYNNLMVYIKSLENIDMLIKSNNISGENTEKEISKFIAEHNSINQRKQFLEKTLHNNIDILSSSATFNFIEKDYISIVKEIKDNTSKLSELIASISNKKNQIDSVTTLKSDLVETGRKLSMLSPVDSKCPLCGYDYKEHSVLLNAISNAEKISSSIEQEISKILKLKGDLELTIADLERTKSIMEKEKNNLIKKDFLFESLQKTEFNYLINKPLCDLPDEIKNIISIISNKIQNNTEKYVAIENILKTNFYNEFINQNQCTNIIKFIIIKKSQALNECADISKTLEELFANMQSINVYAQNASDIESLIDNEENNLANLIQILKHIDVIKDDFPEVKNTSDLKKWCILFENCYSLIEESENIQIEISMKKEKEKILNQLETETKKLRMERERCNIALSAFSERTKLEDNMVDFINENSARIEHIFKLIHRPKEFCDLKIEEGKITFVRTSTLKETNISEISTGQSMSLTFAILLCLHLNAESAPKILIMDEPVANMDDMHILNLIDVIRELVLLGTQIFITTANEQVASFLRRKFSFFGSSFKHLRFERNDSNPSVIREIGYSPYREEPIKIDRLSS